MALQKEYEGVTLSDEEKQNLKTNLKASANSFNQVLKHINVMNIFRY